MSSAPAIHGAAMLACLPSLEKIALGKRHTVETAQEVTSNLQYLAYELVRSNMNESEDSDVRGILGEVSVLSVLWWGTANKHFDEKSYALLTHSSEDLGTRGGPRNGVDIIFRQGGKKPQKHLVQVKNSRFHHQYKSYAPNIRVFTPSDLIAKPNENSGAKKLIRALCNNDLNMLSMAANIATNLFPAK